MGTFRLARPSRYDFFFFFFMWKMASRRRPIAIFDTGHKIYGNEAEVGQSHADSNTQEIWIVHPPNKSVVRKPLAKTKLSDSVKESLTSWKPIMWDLLLIHWPSPQDDKLIWRLYLNELKKSKEDGAFAREIGVSTSTIAQNSNKR